jgi:hypothetical protein
MAAVRSLGGGRWRCYNSGRAHLAVVAPLPLHRELRVRRALRRPRKLEVARACRRARATVGLGRAFRGGTKGHALRERRRERLSATPSEARPRSARGAVSVTSRCTSAQLGHTPAARGLGRAPSGRPASEAPRGAKRWRQALLVLGGWGAPSLMCAVMAVGAAPRRRRSASQACSRATMYEGSQSSSATDAQSASSPCGRRRTRRQRRRRTRVLRRDARAMAAARP